MFLSYSFTFQSLYFQTVVIHTYTYEVKSSLFPVSSQKSTWTASLICIYWNVINLKRQTLLLRLVFSWSHAAPGGNSIKHPWWGRGLCVMSNPALMNYVWLHPEPPRPLWPLSGTARFFEASPEHSRLARHSSGSVGLDAACKSNASSPRVSRIRQPAVCDHSVNTFSVYYLSVLSWFFFL